ncbi:hypothetical protein [Calidithermus roseus]|uniref:hypothetical protein n=1 Tax=Calidithermus roseus TaxID=1644118 RepID=UPI001FECADC1|nr:hypothetical protein [Calidithermus roseus]
MWGTILVVSSVNAFTDPYNALFLPRVAERFFSGMRLPAWLGSDPQAAGLGLFDTVTVNTELIATLWLGARSFPNPLALRYLLLGCFLVALGMLGAVLGGRVGSVRLFFAQALRPLALSAVGALITPLGLSGITLALFLVVLVLLGVGGTRAARDLSYPTVSLSDDRL